jgi:hypothetical protein
MLIALSHPWLRFLDDGLMIRLWSEGLSQEGWGREPCGQEENSDESDLSGCG